MTTKCCNRCKDYNPCYKISCPCHHSTPVSEVITEAVKEFETLPNVKDGGCDGCDLNYTMLDAIRAHYTTTLNHVASVAKLEAETNHDHCVEDARLEMKAKILAAMPEERNEHGDDVSDYDTQLSRNNTIEEIRTLITNIK